MIIIIGCFVLFILIILRFSLREEKEEYKNTMINSGTACCIGNREIQADYGQSVESKAGFFTVLADGIGKNTLGRVSSHIAVDTMVSFYNSYEVITNPSYFFKRGYHQANFEVLKILEGRKGGTSLAAAFITNGMLIYALAGNIQIALFRKGELIPLSEGHTLGVLAGQAYTKGKMTKQQALFAMEKKRVWNYIGQDGFKEIEMLDVPIRLKQKDKIVLMTKGLYENMPWKEIEDHLKILSISPKETAERIIESFLTQENKDKDNSSIYIIEV